MDILFAIFMISSIAVCLLIVCDYMHHVAGMPVKRVAAITFPIWLCIAAMLFYAITY